MSGDGVIGETTYSLAELKSFTSRTYDRPWSAPATAGGLFGEQQGTPRPGTPVGTRRDRRGPVDRRTPVTVLRHAGLRDDAVQVMAVGLDDPYVYEGENHGRVRRPLPIAKALDDVLIAWEMNGEPLPRDHGFPARLVVPGLGRHREHQVARRAAGRHPRRGLAVEHEVVPHARRGWKGDGRRPRPDAGQEQAGRGPRPGRGRTTVLRGRAWSGEATVAQVEVSSDAGETWHEATLTGPNEPSCWVGWELPGRPPRAGDHELWVRATDSLGRRQPEEAPDNDDGYFFSAVDTDPVTGGRARSTARSQRPGRPDPAVSTR